MLGWMDEQEYGILVKAPSWEPIERGLEIQEAWKLGNLEVWRLGGLGDVLDGVVRPSWGPID